MNSPSALTVPDKQRLARVIDYLGQGLVERDAQARCLVLSALAGEHLLFIGPPGTAKSELARRLHRVVGGRYFERLLTRFTVPEELFGPLSLAALDEGRYERDIDGYLPTASIGFLDEVFKANSAILNALLTLLNEREFDQGAQRIAVPLISMIGASNELPDDEALRAFLDRFLFRCPVVPVSDQGFGALLARAETPLADGPALSIDELQAAQQRGLGVRVDESILQSLVELRVFLRGHAVDVSDRRWVRLLRVLRIAAGADQREHVGLQDLALLEVLIAERPEQAELIRDWVAQRLGAQADVPVDRLRRMVEAFERQLELEHNAAEIAFDDSGKLGLLRQVAGADGQTLSADAPRLSAFSRSKRFSASHIRARLAQIDQLMDEIAAFVASAADRQARLLDALRDSLWVGREVVARAQSAITAHAAQLSAQHVNLRRVRERFAALPLADTDDGLVPPPVEASV